MEQIFIEVDREKFCIEFEDRNGWYDGSVYPIDEWENASTGEKGWSYTSKSIGMETHEEINDDVRIMFGFLFTWRGVWEGRIYFKDDEYWSEEIKTMADLWNKIEPILKDKIRQKEPDSSFDD